MSTKSFAFSVLLACSLCSACVEAHPVEGHRPGHEPDAGQGASGDGDGDGDGDSDRDSGAPDAGPPPPSCDPAQCEGASSLLGEAPGCCTDTDRCGLDFSGLGLDACLERDAPGALDTSCPATSVFGFITFPGCCAAGGVCGRMMETFLPLGCLPGDVEVPIPGFENTTPMACTTFSDPE